jgi:hypothetical protein
VCVSSDLQRCTTQGVPHYVPLHSPPSRHMAVLTGLYSMGVHGILHSVGVHSKVHGILLVNSSPSLRHTTVEDGDL